MPYLVVVRLLLVLLTLAVWLPPTTAQAPAEFEAAPAPAPGATAAPANQVSLFFGGGSAYLYPQEIARLRDFLAAHGDLAAYTLQLQGHTDDIGDRAYNLRLSAARVTSVRRWLLAQDIPDAAIEALPLGEDAPAFSNDTWEGKLNNRRVDVILRPLM